MKTKFCSLSLMLCLAVGAQAQNPIIRDQFAADPTARVFNNRVYVYPSHDIPAPEGQRQDWFCMADYHVFSSDNLTDWTDHGVIVSQEQVPWGKSDAYSMWAPDCVEKDGRYYFYFPNAPRSGRGFAIGVAISDAPTGPFRLEAEPIHGVSGIDPCVLLDDDGTAYLYWSGMGIRGARLKDNMTELADELQTVSTPQGGSMQVGGQQMEGLPEGFKEGPFAFKRDGWYYLTFPWVRQEGDTETLAYAMSRSRVVHILPPQRLLAADGQASFCPHRAHQLQPKRYHPGSQAHASRRRHHTSHCTHRDRPLQRLERRRIDSLR